MMMVEVSGFEGNRRLCLIKTTGALKSGQKKVKKNHAAIPGFYHNHHDENLTVFLNNDATMIL